MLYERGDWILNHIIKGQMHLRVNEVLERSEISLLFRFQDYHTIVHDGCDGEIVTLNLIALTHS